MLEFHKAKRRRTEMIIDISKCVLNGCGKRATKKFFLRKNIEGKKNVHISLCDNCFNKVLRQQNDNVKNQISILNLENWLKV